MQIGVRGVVDTSDGTLTEVLEHKRSSDGLANGFGSGFWTISHSLTLSPNICGWFFVPAGKVRLPRSTRCPRNDQSGSINVRCDTGSYFFCNVDGSAVTKTSSVGETIASITWPPLALPSRWPTTMCV